MRAWWASNPGLADALLAAALTALSLGAVAAVHDGAGDPAAATWPAMVVLTGSLALRRRAPQVVLVVVAVAAIVIWWTEAIDGPTAAAGGIAIHAVGRHVERPTSLRWFTPVAVVLVAGAALAAARDGTAEGVFTFAARCSVVLGTFWLGDGQRARAALTESYRERAERAERDRQDAARRAVVDERARIARELHDVVAHSVSVIVVQASVAERLADRDPDGSRAALSHVGQVARTTLGEMRRLVDVLDGDTPNTELAPQPSITDLDALVERCRAAGLGVRLRVIGATHDLAPALQLTVYRLVQEALTNVIKHAPAAQVDVCVDAGVECPGTVKVEVIDDGPTPPAGPSAAGSPHVSAGGRGLVGMRERVHAWHGELCAGPRPEGGFRVHAVLGVDG